MEGVVVRVKGECGGRMSVGMKMCVLILPHR